MNLFISIVFLIIVLFFYNLERTKEYKITPIFALGIPYGVIMLLVTIFDTFNNYNEISFWVPILSCIYIIIFGIIGLLVSTIFLSKKQKNKSTPKLTKDTRTIKFNHSKAYLFLMLFCLLIIIIYYFINFGFNVNDYLIIKDSFANGLPAHIINLITILMIVNYANLKKGIYTRKFKLIFYSFYIIWIILLLVNTKYALFMFVFSLIFIHYYTNYHKFKWKKIAITSVIASSLFIVVYIVRFLTQGYNLQSIPYSFIFQNFYFYLTSGFYGYSKIIENSLIGEAGFGIIFAPVMNVYKLIINDGNLITTVANFIPVELGSSFSSTNVFTLFGAIQYETSILSTILLLILLSFFIYINFFKMVRYNQIKLLPLNSYLCSTLVFSFFNCFYGTITVWEITIGLLLFAYIEKIKF